MKNKITKTALFIFIFTSSLSAELVTPSKAYIFSLEKSNKLKSREYQYLSKKEALNQHYSKLYPSINASISYNDVNYESNELLNRAEPNINEVSTDYMISLRQTIYDHSVYTKIDAEKKRIELLKRDLEKKKQELAAEVLNVYLEIFKAKNKIHLINTAIKYSEHNLSLIEKKLKMKLANKIDFLEAKIELERNRIELVKEKKTYDVQMLKLKQFIDKEDIEIPVLNLDVFSKNVVNNLEKFNFQESELRNNLEIIQSKLSIEMGGLEIKNAFSAHYPKLTFDARYTYYDSNDITTDYEDYSKVSLNLEIPIYRGGSISSKVAELRLVQNAAKEDLKSVNKDLKIKFNELKLQLNQSTNNMKVYRDALVSSRTYEETIELSLNSGLKSILDLYNARTKVLKIENEYIENIQTFIDSYVGFLILTNNLEKLSLIDTIILE